MIPEYVTRLTCPRVIADGQRCGTSIHDVGSYCSPTVKGEVLHVKLLCLSKKDGLNGHYLTEPLSVLWSPLELAEAAYAGLTEVGRHDLAALIQILLTWKQAGETPDLELISKCASDYDQGLWLFALMSDLDVIDWDALCRDWAGLPFTQSPEVT